MITVQDVELRAGARLLLYTDGLIEHGPAAIDDALAALAADVEARREAPIGALLDALVRDGTGGDDVCLLCVEYGPRS